MKTVYSLFAMILVITLIGCGSSEPSAVDASAQVPPTEDHDHEHGHDDHEDGDHDHAGHDHDQSDHPDSFEEALQHIEDMGSKITAAFAKAEPDDAHDELHEIGHMIESLPALAKKAGLPESKQEKVMAIAEALMDAFGELDGTLHGGDEVDAEKISQTISAQIEELQVLL